MYTQCPQCRTIFEIDEDALQASLGIVRCGHCAERFDALRTLSDTLPTDLDTTLPEHDPDALAPTLTSAVSPEAMQAAAKPARPWATSSSGNDSATHVGEAWFDALAGDRTRALIADAAGLPPEAIQGDAAWQLTDVPVQTRFAELDIIPMANGEDAMKTGIPDAIPPASADAEAAESEPFTDAWGLDIPEVEVTEAAPSEAASAIGEAESLPSEDAPAEFVDDLDAAVDLPTPEIESGPDAWLPEGEFQAGNGSTPHADIAGHEDLASIESQDEAATEESEAAEPVYVPPRRRRIRRSDGLWALGCVVLALVLAAQIAWASRVALVRDPTTQAQALRICARVDCRLPPIRDIAKLELLSRDIRPDPDAAGALAITATFRNDAPFRQSWPVVVVELTDLDNNVVAMRRFRPPEYMPDPARRAAGIAPGATAAVAFEVADPGKRAVSFHFGFD
ncbi:MAG: hypothetical protein OJF61_002536 [Rhodanobacteraceae bacterium]|jgi:predicted Zn finger-like uncharacterized protein|nr:MAG: hypothetical protein OJF61_002536 [Rhodanobacteraceae bacterium]